MEGKTEEKDTTVDQPSQKAPQPGSLNKTSAAEKEFRADYEKGADDFNTSAFASTSGAEMNNMVLFNPVQGVVTNTYGAENAHFAVDVATKAGEPVKSVLEGCVILSSWTPETGYVIAVQHKNNLVSIYKHNATLLKKTGTFVQTGETIAIVGNTGELTSGPHLHFELWENCRAVNPERFIIF